MARSQRAQLMVVNYNLVGSVGKLYSLYWRYIGNATESYAQGRDTGWIFCVRFGSKLARLITRLLRRCGVSSASLPRHERAPAAPGA